MAERAPGQGSPLTPRSLGIGLLLAFVVGSIQGLHHYYPFVPAIQLNTSLKLLPNSVSIPVILSFATLGFFFLIQREVAFGLWVFFLFNVVQQASYALLGLGAEREPALSVWSYNVPSLVHQNMGAMIVLVAGMAWVGREHLGMVLRRAFQAGARGDDSDEIVSYRGAVFSLLGSLAAILVWLCLAGIPLLGALVFLFFALVVFVALTRVIVEGGVAVLYPPLVAPDAALSAVGTPLFGNAGLVGLVFTRIWANDILNFAMPHCANGLKLSEQIGQRRRWLLAAMLGGMLAGLGGALWMLLKLAYAYGAINLRPAHFIWLPHYVYEYAAAHMSAPSGPDLWGWFHTGLGGLLMAGLMLAALEELGVGDPRLHLVAYDLPGLRRQVLILKRGPGVHGLI
jgi:hypothetical protein